MDDNAFKKIITSIINFEDLSQALDDKVVYKKVKEILSSLIKGDPLDINSVNLVENAGLNQLLYKLLEEAKIGAEGVISIIKKDLNLYKGLYTYIDDTSLVAKLLPVSLDEDLDNALNNTLNTWYNQLESDKERFYDTVRDTVDYYIEILEVIRWCSFEYCKSTDAAKEFIKKHIDSIVESNYPNKTLQQIKLASHCQLSSLEIYQRNTGIFKNFLCISIGYLNSNCLSQYLFCSIKAIKQRRLNQKHLSKFIEISAMNNITEPVKFSSCLVALWAVIINKNNSAQNLFSRLIALFMEVRNKNKKYKAQRKEILKLISDFQKTIDSFVFNKKGVVQDEINFKALATEICMFSINNPTIKLNKKNPTLDKLFEKFNHPNMNDAQIKGQVEVIYKIYHHYGNVPYTTGTLNPKNIARSTDSIDTIGTANPSKVDSTHSVNHDGPDPMRNPGSSCNTIRYAGTRNAEVDEKNIAEMDIIDEKKFILQHMDAILDHPHPLQAYDAVSLIYFYADKGYKKKWIKDLSETFLKDNFPKNSFFYFFYAWKIYAEKNRIFLLKNNSAFCQFLTEYKKNPHPEKLLASSLQSNAGCSNSSPDIKTTAETASLDRVTNNNCVFFKNAYSSAPSLNTEVATTAKNACSLFLNPDQSS